MPLTSCTTVPSKNVANCSIHQSVQPVQTTQPVQTVSTAQQITQNNCNNRGVFNCTINSCECNFGYSGINCENCEWLFLDH